MAGTDGAGHGRRGCDGGGLRHCGCRRRFRQRGARFPRQSDGRR